MSDTGYVAVAYLVFLALVLIYGAIMAARLARVAKDVDALADTLEGRDAERAREAVPS